MALMKYSGWPTLSNFFDDDRHFSSPWMGGQRLPAVNVKETDKNYEIELAAPGFDKKDFNISIEEGLLTISGEQRENKETKDENYTRREFQSSSFSRSFNLPQGVNEEDINARYEGGVLKLTLPRREETNGKAKKSISIK